MPRKRDPLVDTRDLLGRLYRYGAGVDLLAQRRVVLARTPTADRCLTGLSVAANRSALWMGIAAVTAIAGGSRGRRAARAGVAGIGVASAVVNGPLKAAARRTRPEATADGRYRSLVAVPGSFSFPSGHAASAFAFATGMGAVLPWMRRPLRILAGLVGYSRVYTGVHFPSDVVVGAGIGVLAGRLSTAMFSAKTAPRKDAVLLVSGGAGRSEDLARVREQMQKAGFRIRDEIPVEGSDRLRTWTSRPRPPLVVAAGGDGTAGAAADQVAGTEALLGILPLGTSNDFSRSLEIPARPVRAVRVLASGRISTIDAGRFVMPGRPGRHFVHAATAGANVDFAKLATREGFRRRFGRFAYIVAAVRTLRRAEAFDCVLRYDGGEKKLRLMHLAVVNTPVFGGSLGMRLGGVRLDDRALDVVAIEPIPFLRLVWTGLHAIVGFRQPVRGVHVLRTAALQVRTGRSVDVTLDGEISGCLPARFEVAEDALRVLRPE